MLESEVWIRTKNSHRPTTTTTRPNSNTIFLPYAFCVPSKFNQSSILVWLHVNVWLWGYDQRMEFRNLHLSAFSEVNKVRVSAELEHLAAGNSRVYSIIFLLNAQHAQATAQPQLQLAIAAAAALGLGPGSNVPRRWRPLAQAVMDMVACDASEQLPRSRSDSCSKIAHIICTQNDCSRSKCSPFQFETTIELSCIH